MPDYLEFIQTPMDLATMAFKLEGLQYTTLEQFEVRAKAVWLTIPDILFKLIGQTELPSCKPSNPI